MIGYFQISDEEFKQNEQELTRMCGDANVRTFWKAFTRLAHSHAPQVPFEEVLELVGSRQVLLHKGQAFVPSSQLSSIVVGRFRSNLSKTMLQMHKVTSFANASGHSGSGDASTGQ